MDTLWNKVFLAGIAAAAGWHALGPQGRQSIMGFLDQLAVAAEQQRQQQSQPAPVETVQVPLVQPALLPISYTIPSAPAARATGSKPAAMPQPDVGWLKVIEHPAVMLILGKRGSGKSALAYRLLEMFRYRGTPYVVGVPTRARKLLPEWIGIVPTLEEAPTGSIVLVDEAYMLFHSRRSMAQDSTAMSQTVNLSRQRQQTLIFVSQEARQVDRNIASAASVVAFKDLGMLQLEFDRRELNKLATQAREALGGVRGDQRRWTYVYAPDADFLGLMENELPSFWKPRMSRLFAGDGAPASPRPPERMTPGQKANRAKAMREQGGSYGQIATALGVTRGTVLNYLKDYPYRAR